MKLTATITTLCLAMLLLLSCSNEDNNIITPPTGENPDPDPINLADEVEIYESDLIHDNITLAVVNGAQNAFLMNKEGQKLHEWTFDDRLGNDLELLPDGKLLGIFKDDNAIINFGGYGGKVKIINPDGSIVWEYALSNNDFILHHDVEMLPNGNVLLLVWERIEDADAEAQGSTNPGDIFPEKLMEIDPSTDTIVWEWRSFEHIIQDNDPAFPNYGIVSQHPEKIHINYNPASNGDIMHANGIDYDENKDIIYLSVNFFSEVWVIDHSTTTAEAATSSGGNYGKGGDLVYRFGNPLAYDNTVGPVISDNNHFPNLLENGVPGEGNILLFVNGFDVGVSKVVELEMPQTFTLTPDANNEPNIIWSYQNSDLFASKISGAVRLQNGNTLICEGDFGFWEITPDKEIAWRYNGGDGAAYWRCYDYETTDPALNPYGF